MKLCCVIITYYPKVEDVVGNILRYIDDTDHLIIWENTPKSECDNYKICVPRSADKISYMSVGRNVCIAYALNRAAEWAVENHYTHLMTMDQDSQWENFGAYKQTIMKYEPYINIGLFTPKFIINCSTGKSISREQGEITSGSVVPVTVFKSLGRMFNEDYMIDNVDFEFYYYILSKGLTCEKIEDGVLYHNLGYYKEVSICKRTFYTKNYSPFRLYYICRNSIWMWKDYHHQHVLPKVWSLPAILKRTFINMIKVLLFESSKYAKIRAIIKGCIDGVLLKHKNISSI